MTTMSISNPSEQQTLGTTNLNTPEYYQTQRNAVNNGQPMVDAAANIPQPKDYTAYIPQTPAAAMGDNLPPLQSSPAGPTVSTDIQQPDAGAIRRRLLGSIPGATDAAGLPYNANFDTGVQNLYANTMNKLVGYNQQEGQLGTQYEASRDAALQNYDAAQKNLMDRMAFQGILSSGITTDQRALLGQNYSQKLANMANAQAAALASLAQNRLATQGDYATKLSDLESKYTGDLSTWVQQQAAQQAAREQNQAQQDANAQLLAQLAAATKPPIPEATMDYGTLLGSLDPTNLPAFEAPGGFLDKFFQNRTQILDENGNPMSIAAIMQLLTQPQGQ